MPETRSACTETMSAQIHSETIDGTTYEVMSNYVGNIPLIDLFKLMLKWDIEKTNQ